MIIARILLFLRPHLLKFQAYRRIFIILSLLIITIPSAMASYTPFNTNVGGNIGVGTATPQGKFVVIGGNVGIGTWAPNSQFQVNGVSYLNGNVGIGTSMTFGGLSVMNGNLGIGTWVPSQALDIRGNMALTGSGDSYFNGNLGIGNSTPTQALDVTGTGKMAGFMLTTGPSAGYVLVSSSVGVGTWMPASTLSVSSGSGSNWIYSSGGNVGLSTTAAVGIGTTFVGGAGEAALSVMNGNVGIGTWVPDYPLQVNAGASTLNALKVVGRTFINADILAVGQGSPNTQFFTATLELKPTSASNYGLSIGPFSAAQTADLFDINTLNASIPGTQFSVKASGNVGIGTNAPGAELDVEGTLYPTVFYGRGTDYNVGIGSLTPGQALDVQGTVRATGFTMSGSSPLSGYVLTSTDSTGDATWSSAGGVSGWTISGNNIYETNISGNVGIGVTTPNQTLEVNGGIQIDGAGDSYFSSGNLGVGTITPQAAFVVTNGSVGIGTWTAAGGSLIVASGNVGIGSLAPNGSLDVGSGTICLGHTCNSSWPAGGGSSNWLYSSSGNVGLSTTAAVGIGTTFVGGAGEAALSVMNGNVGIGTWVPNAMLSLGGQMNWMSGLGSITQIAGPSDQSITIAATAPIQGATTIVGNSVNITASNATAGTGGTSGRDGGAINLTAGAGARVGVGTNTNGGVITIQAGNVGVIGAGVSGSVNIIGGSGTNGSVNITAGNDGGNNSGAGGNILIQTPNATSNGSSSIGTITIQGGSGVVSAANNGSNGGPISIIAGNGAEIGSGGGIGKNGGAVTISSGAGGIGSVTGGNSGGIVLQVGLSGTGPTAGSRGSIQLAPTGGNVGIGTLTPLSILNVNGGVGIGTSSLNGAYLNGNSAPSGGLIVQNNVGIGTFNPFGGGLIILPANTGNVGIGSLTPGQALDVTGTVRAIQFIGDGSQLSNLPSSGASGWTLGAGNVGISTTNNVGIGTNLTTTAGLTVMNGNVGIGTWVPKANLQVIGSGGNKLLDIENGTSSGAYFEQVVSGRMDIVGSNSIQGIYNPLMLQAGSNGVYIGTDGNIGMGTVTPAGGLAVMNGNVGIGTWVPKFALDTNGAINVSGKLYFGGNAVSTGTINFNGSSGEASLYSQYAPFVFDAGAAAGGGNYAFNFQDGGLNLLTISYSNVGIGSLAPGQALDVQGTVRALGEVLTSNVPSVTTNELYNNSGTLYFNGSIVGGSNYWLNNGGSNVGINTTQAVGIGTSFVGGTGEATLSIMNGNVGIGTWVPTSPLTVRGELDLENTTNGAYGMYYWTGVNTGDTGGLGFAFPGTLSFTGYTFNTRNGAGNQIQALQINHDGNIGMGTSITVAGLAVMNGNVGIGTWVPGTILDIESGNVGIGSSAPNSVLGLNGDVSFTKGATRNIYVTPTSTAGAAGVGGDLDIYAGSAGPVCFAGGTKITMGNGKLKNIEEIKVGETVRSYDVNKHNVVNSKVTQVFHHSSKDVSNGYLIMTIEGGHELKVTPNHPLYVNGQWKEAGTLRAGDQLLNESNKKERIIAIKKVIAQIPVFNLEVNQYHDYFAEGVLVHNKVAGSGGTVYIYGGSSATKNGNVSLAYTGSGQQGNVGIGTNLVTTAGVSIMNGNVGIGTWVVDSGGLIVANGAGNVGIGTIRPGQALDVNGTVRATQFLGDGSQLTGISGGSSNWLYSSSGNVGLSTTAAVGIGTTFVGGTGEAALSIMNGNVGIGTWMPTVPLDIVTSGLVNLSLKSTSTTGYTQLRYLSTGYAYQTGVGNPSEINFGVANKYYIYDGSAGLMRMVLDSNGNVGIGTALPYTLLDERGGEIRVLGGASYGTIPTAGKGLELAYNTSNDMATIVAYNRDTSAYKTLTLDGSSLVLNGTSGGNVGIGTTTPVGGLTVMNGNVGIGTWVPSQALDIKGSLNLSGSGNSYFNGNVGIGSVNPTQALDVNGEVRMTGFNLNAGSSLNNKVLTSDASGNGTWQTAAGGSGTNFWLNTAAPGNVGLSTTNTVGIGTTSAGTGAGLIVMNGNVGIGTWVPAANVDSAGTIRTTSFKDPTSGAGIEMNYSASGNLGNIFAYDRTNSLYRQLKLDGSSVIINSGSSGSVGVGTTSPGSQFSILGGVSLGAYATNTAPAGGLIVSGNVGIGTWLPASGVEMATSFAVFRTATAASVSSAGQTIIGVTSTAAPRTITLATADVVRGRVIIVKDESGGAGANNITIQGQGGETIDGQASVVITSNYGVVRLYSDGTHWFTF
jgi:hypothetical protein